MNRKTSSCIFPGCKNTQIESSHQILFTYPGATEEIFYGFACLKNLFEAASDDELDNILWSHQEIEDFIKDPPDRFALHKVSPWKRELHQSPTPLAELVGLGLIRKTSARSDPPDTSDDDAPLEQSHEEAFEEKWDAAQQSYET